MRRAVLVAVLPVMIGIFPWTPGPGVASVAAAGPPGTVSCAPSPVGPPTSVKPVTGFTPMSPIRLIDTRDGTGGPSGVLGIGCVLRIDTSSITGIPAGADALSLSVTSVDAPQLGFLTVFPCGGARPGTSNINTRIGVAAANNVVAALDSTRAVCIYASTVTHLVVDLFGWYGSSGMQYVDIAPVRALDTRFGPTPTGVNVGRVIANTPLVLPIAASWVPGAAEAVLVNLTVASSLGPGYLVAYPCGTAPPLASNVNFLTGEDRAGSTMVGLGPDGSLCLLSNVDVHMVVDINGYFEPATFGPKTIIQPLAGSRIVDSRDGTGGWTTRMAANEVRSFDPTPDSAVIDNVYSATLNVIATEAVGAGHLRLFPCGGATPTVSSLNFDAKGEATNLVTVPVGQDGRICVFASIATQVVIDEFATLQAPGLAKRLVITGGVPFPTFDVSGLDYDMICPAAGADLTIDALGTPQVATTVDGAATTTKHLAVDGLMRVKFTRGAESTEYTFRCLPPDFPPYNVDRRVTPQPGWYLGGMGWSAATVGRFIVILDNHGAVIWYKRTNNQFVLDVKPWPSGSAVPALAWTPQLGAAFGTDPARGYRVTSLNGDLLAELKTDTTATDHHDLVSLPGGNRAMITYVRRVATVDLTSLQPVAAPGVTLFGNDTAVDSEIQELQPDGTVIWSWNSGDHFSLSETTLVPQRFNPPSTVHGGAVDLAHINSIDRQPDGDYIVSARHFDSVFRVDRATDKVLWKLGGSAGPNLDGAAHMTIIGDPLGGPKRMHDARLNAAGVLTMFDNQSGTGHPPRVVAYQLDETANTATFLWQRTYPNPAASSFGLGSARLQPNGSVVVSWSVLQPMLEELDSAGNRLLAITDPALGAISYRFIKEPLAAFDREQLLLLAGGNAQAP